jgi:hypothetical protein
MQVRPLNFRHWIVPLHARQNFVRNLGEGDSDSACDLGTREAGERYDEARHGCFHLLHRHRRCEALAQDAERARIVRDRWVLRDEGRKALGEELRSRREQTRDEQTKE